MQSIGKAENIGYMVPMPIIQHFLTDIEDGQYDNFPSMGLILQNMENPTLKQRYKVAENQPGVLVTHIIPGSPAEGVFQMGDVIISLDDHNIANDGTVEFRPKQRTRLNFFVDVKQVGETVDVEFLRNGALQRETLTLHRSLREDWLIPKEEFDRLPTYYIYGGIVFCPVTKNLLREWGSGWYNTAPKELVAILSRNYRAGEINELVIARKVLASGVNEGYHDIANWLVVEVNGTPIRDLRHLISLIETCQDNPYIEVKGANGQIVIMNRHEVAATEAAILSLYHINADRSPDLREEDSAASVALPSTPEVR